MPRVILDGDQNLIVKLANGFQVDVFIARPAVKELLSETPTNFGTLLVCRTGSKNHNIYLCRQAQSLGLSWNPYHGVFRGDELIASATEEEVFAALNLPWITPEMRGWK